MKKKYIFFILIIVCIISIFIVCKTFNNYIILDETNSYKYEKLQSIHKDIDIYNSTRQEFEKLKIRLKTNKKITDAIDNYNKSITLCPINDPSDVYKKTKDFYDFLYEYTKFGVFEEKLTKPYFVTYNENANIWIVQENIYNKPCTINNLPGGEFVVFIDANDGSIMFITRYM